MLLVLAAVIIITSSMTVNANSLNIKMGLFYPQLDSDLWTTNMENLALVKSDMQNPYYAIEYEHFLDRTLSLSIEGGYYKKEHFSQYKDYEYQDGSPIYQNLSLETANLDLGFKFYPVGNRTRIAPYLGGGISLYYWKYSQWGDFINFQDDTIDQDQYAESTKYTPTFHAKGGVLINLSRSVGVSFEARYHALKGELSSFFEGFEKLDMGGFSIMAGINIRFPN